MEILRNSVVLIEENGNIENGIYRILEVYPDENLVCIFRLKNKAFKAKPRLLDIPVYESLLEAKLILPAPDLIPKELIMSEEKISKEDKTKRDYLYHTIESLIADPLFLLHFASKQRTDLIKLQAKNQNVAVLVVYRALRKFWEFGQTKNALLIFRSTFGVKGKRKSAGSKQRGRPINRGHFGLLKRVSINIDDTEKQKIHLSVLKHIKNDRKLRYSKAYEYYLADYCSEELKTAVLEKRPAQVATKGQFYYWATRLVSKEEVNKTMLSDSAFQSNFSANTSSVSDKAPVPGMIYEIDSTVADVYIVSEFNRDIVLGRPIVYILIDCGSRMIAGLHITMRYASWNQAREAIFNAVTSKVEFCKRYGVDISDVEWPCVGMPAQIRCDRAELIGSQAEVLVERLDFKLLIAPPYRGDAKSIVESRFGIINEEVHFLPGTTLGQLRERGEPDYRLDAALTIHAFTKVLIELCIEHNKYRKFDDLITADMVRHNLAPTPINYWNLHIRQHRHALHQLSPDMFIAKLMKPELAVVTDKGIKLDERHYTCEKFEKENWATKARINGYWKLEARIDSSWTNDIYIREENSRSFIKCSLLPKDGVFGHKHTADIIYIEEWRKSKKEFPDLELSKAERRKKNEILISEEKKSTQTAVRNAGSSKRKRILDIRKNRAEYIEGHKKTLPPSSNIKAENFQQENLGKRRENILKILKDLSD